jgi:hypothetical protein
MAMTLYMANVGKTSRNEEVQAHSRFPARGRYCPLPRRTSTTPRTGMRSTSAAKRSMMMIPFIRRSRPIESTTASRMIWLPRITVSKVFAGRKTGFWASQSRTAP